MINCFNSSIYAQVVYEDNRIEETYVTAFQILPNGDIVYTISGLDHIWPIDHILYDPDHKELRGKIFAHKSGRGKKTVFRDDPLPTSINEDNWNIKLIFAQKMG